MHKRVCENCLVAADDVRGIDVGPEHGTQRDSWREQLWLCPQCADHLLAHNLQIFAERFTTERKVTREDATG